MSAPPVWIDARAILFLHDESLAMFGGARGLHDAGLAKNRPFVDGNKRTAFLALGLFLAVNGWRLETTLSLAKGALDEASLASWIRGRSVREK